MVATFCLRLAFGMIVPLTLLDPKPIPPRFFRVQFLVTLALLALAGCFLFADQASVATWLVVIAAGVLCFIGSIIWHTDAARGGVLVVHVTSLTLAVLLWLTRVGLSGASGGGESIDLWHAADQYASALVLGTATSAMLLGHSYLISPAMTIVPLRRMLCAIFGALVMRAGFACWGLARWTSEQSLGNLETETLLWLSARWMLGIFAPLGLTWMAWETARIRSTQSATGILYVVVIVVFLGELTSLLLFEKTGSVL